MRREDLFIAIGAIDDERLALCEKRMDPSAHVYREDSRMYHRKHAKKIWLIAAIITLMLLLMGSAVATLVTMRVSDTKLFFLGGETQAHETINTSETQPPETTDAIPGQTEPPFTIPMVQEGEIIHFDKVQDVFLGLGTCYPQKTPEGYIMTFVSNDAPLQNQLVRYENSAGNSIEYHIYIGGPASSIEIYGITQKTDVTVNGLQGILYNQTGSRRTLVWVSEKQGYGFALQVNDPAVDILAMAESTGEGEPLVPTHNGKTLQALKELGDFDPEYLPAGFEELNVQGWPLEGNWYSYMRKWYVNKAENTHIYFTYETYVIDTDRGYTDDAKTACSFHIPGYHILKGEAVGEEVEINGMFGIVTDEDIAWANPKKHVVFHLHSENITGDELLKVAQSISLAP